MKTVLMMIGMLGLVGCTSTPADVKQSPVARTLHAEAPYKLLGQCLQQKLQDEARSWAEMRLTFQDWEPSAELTYLQQLNIAGSVQTIYVTTLKPLPHHSTILSVRLNKGLFPHNIKKNLEDIEQGVKSCETLLTRTQ